ncbi:MAG: HlyD family efflux transporter periplasmic adaptor subunit [Saprospiraceae bacterium]|nr:HlyD family efflux transporter periplasmic adaptor subunit [Saprospiraceae bacterium]
MNFIFMLSISCSTKDVTYDATGTFEASEIIVSAETSGKILQFKKVEGDSLFKDEQTVSIDGTNIMLQKDQAESSVSAIALKQNSASPQINILTQQLKVAESQISALSSQYKVLQKEQVRINNLFKSDAATEQQYDDINGKIEVMQRQIATAENQKTVIKSQITAAKEQIFIQNRGINSEKVPLEKRVAILDDQLKKTVVVNPFNGTLLTKYAFEGEFISMGKPLYKLADLSLMTLRAYVTGDQLPRLKIGQKVRVFLDNGSEAYSSYPGSIVSIASKAEFTPKSIQTKDERANLVYSVKINVKNDGFIKIGMYGEVSFDVTKDKE